MGDNEIELTALVENGEKEQVRNRVRSRAGKLNIDTPRDGDGRTPLGIAVENGDKDMVEVLVNAGADINKPCPATPLMQAVVLTNYDIIATLIRLHADVNAGSEYNSQEYFSPANSSGQISRDGGTHFDGLNVRIAPRRAGGDTRRSLPAGRHECPHEGGWSAAVWPPPILRTSLFARHSCRFATQNSLFHSTGDRSHWRKARRVTVISVLEL